MIVELRVNGRIHRVEVEPEETLLEVLRRLGYKSVKYACGTGECGACTVLLDGKSVKSCILFAWQAEGREITTLEGLSRDGDLHPIQEAFIEAGAVQCGYCIPGFIMEVAYLLSVNPNPSEEEIKKFLEGNLCRCGGYQKIIEAVKLAAEKMRHG
ncbi:MAG TPA: (2Fe-2S)-binding protein [Aciduliprofundum sp.]|nr:(2Fe-2S)-binding protein [Aciduliprofundum sp.]